MKKYIGLVPVLCLLLCGCDRLPAAREMGDMALLRTMGVVSYTNLRAHATKAKRVWRLER